MDIASKDFFTEGIFYNNIYTSYRIKELLYDKQSKFQRIQVYDTHAVGRLLTLDGKTMVSQKDEFVYHEVMAHIPSMISRNAKSVLIIGGGDGGVVRELVKYPNFEKIHLVEIDEEVIEVSRKFFPECTCGLNDPRVKIIATDGIEFIKKATNEYDIILIDSTDPVDLAQGLFTQTFYANVFKALSANGIMIAQAENVFLDQYDVKSIFSNLKKAFPIVQAYWAPITIYPGIFWNFAFASKTWNGTDIDPAKIEWMITKQDELKWYNMDWHKNAAFTLANFHKKTLGL